MLKRTTVYFVDVTMKDETQLVCSLLTAPTIKTLQQIAEAKKAKTELREALAFSRPIATPEVTAPDKGGCVPETPLTVDTIHNSTPATTEIVVAGLVIGIIKVSVVTAYSEVRRKRTKKTTEALESVDTPELVTANVDPDVDPDDRTGL